jgi:beta-keto acid cleavage enzyme
MRLWGDFTCPVCASGRASARASQIQLIYSDVTMERLRQKKRRGLERRHGIRTGLEDITVLPDGRQVRDNADLVAAAARLIRAQLVFINRSSEPT